MSGSFGSHESLKANIWRLMAVSKEQDMSKTIRIYAVVAALMASSLGFAQSGDVYKGKCQSCHGAAGTPSPAMAKAMGVKPSNDPSVKAHSLAQMVTITTDGKGKMPAFKGKLTDSQIKDSVEYFRSLAK